MANTSEQFVNSTLLTYEVCLKENYFGYFFYFLISALCFLIGTPGHLWCFMFDCCIEKSIKETQLFLLNYTIIELIYCLECGLELLQDLILQNYVLWYVTYFLFGLSWTGRPLLQMCICIEQYMAVCHPVTFLRYKGIKYRIAAAATAWLSAFAYGVYETYSDIFPDFFYTSAFIIALVVNSFCCVSLLCALKRPGPGDSHSRIQTSRVGGNQQKKNAFNTIFLSLLLILFTYLPQTIFIILADIGIDNKTFKCTVIPVITALNIFGAIITPLFKLYKKRHLNCLKNEK